MSHSAMKVSIVLWSVIMLSSSISSMHIPQFNNTSGVKSLEEKFCSNSYIHQSLVKYEILNSGEIRARAQVMITLRAGETVCLRAELTDPKKDSKDEQQTEKESLFYEDHKNEINGKIPAAGEGSNKEIIVRSQQLGIRRKTRSTLEGILKQKNLTPKSEFRYVNKENDKTEKLENSLNYYEVRLEPTNKPLETQPWSKKANNRPNDSKSFLSNPNNAQTNHQTTKKSMSLFNNIFKKIITSNLENDSIKNDKSNTRNVLSDSNNHFYIRITAEKTRFHYPILSSYEFAEPAINITCTCACTAFHTCPSCGNTCVDLPVVDETVMDCRDSLLGVAHTCCHVQLKQGTRGFTNFRRVPPSAKYRSARTFRAVQLGRPIPVIGLNFDSSRRLEQQPARVHVPLGGAFRVNLNETQLSGVSGGWTDEPLQPGWYVVHNHELYRTPNINRHGEYNLQKLGWLKVENNKLLLPSAERLRASIQVTTDSCTKQKFQINENILLDAVAPQLGESVSSIDDMTVTSDHVSVTASRRETSAAALWLSLAFEHVQTLRPVVDRASLSDFSGHLQVNNRSQAEAKLQLEGASGLIRGTVKVDYGQSQLPHALFHFSWQAGTGGENTIEVRSFLLPVAFGRHQNEAEMCLEPSPSEQGPVCRVLRIIRQQRSPLPADTMLNRHLLVNSKTNPMNKIEQFVRSLNPANWLSPSSWSWTTALGAIVDGVLLLIAVSLAWKCLGCCISCFGRKKK